MSPVKKSGACVCFWYFAIDGSAIFSHTFMNTKRKCSFSECPKSNVVRACWCVPDVTRKEELLEVLEQLQGLIGGPSRRTDHALL